MEVTGQDREQGVPGLPLLGSLLERLCSSSTDVTSVRVLHWSISNSRASHGSMRQSSCWALLRS